MRRREPTVPAFFFEEALEDVAFWRAEAEKYKAQAERLLAVNKRTEQELGEELVRLQQDNAHLMHWNAGLALEVSEKDWALAQLRGEC